ncbi:MAG TPA: thioesterase family protein [Longimicrobiaceae bacterium]|nr:thioesterase family protein [Longimicrobium sp.]
MSEETRRGTTIEFRVRYAETDQMGVVYHANYLVWCEVGRTELIRQRFASYAEVERAGVLLAVSEASLRFHAAARYDDMIRVETTVREVRSRTVTFDYLVSRLPPDGPPERLVTATTTLIALDRDSRPRTLPSDLLARLRDG